VRVLLGTDDGLRTLDGDVLTGQPIIAVSGAWALASDGHLLSHASPGEVKLDGPRGWCLLDTGTMLYAGTAEARLFAGSRATGELAAVESFDEIPTRDQWYTPWGAPPDTRSLAAGADGTVLVNVHVGGVWRSDGDRWVEVVEVDADTHQVAADGDRRIAVAAAAAGFGRSLDDGRTWDWTAEGLHASYCRAAAIAGDITLVTAATGPGSKRGAIYRRPLTNDGPFEQCRAGLPQWFPFNLDTGQLAASGNDVALGTADGRLFRSSDAGATWELAADGLPPVRCVSIAKEGIDGSGVGNASIIDRPA
jgi:hypothetical protein